MNDMKNGATETLKQAQNLQDKAFELEKEGIKPADSIRKAIEFYRSIRDELVNAWQASKLDKRVEVVEEIRGADVTAVKTKRTVRTETRKADAGLLRAAMAAQKEILKLEERLAELIGQDADSPDRITSCDGILAKLAKDHWDETDMGSATPVRLDDLPETLTPRFSSEGRGATDGQNREQAEAFVDFGGLSQAAGPIETGACEKQAEVLQAAPVEPASEPKATDANAAKPVGSAWDQERKAHFREKAEKKERERRKRLKGWTGASSFACR